MGLSMGRKGDLTVLKRTKLFPIGKNCFRPKACKINGQSTIGNNGNSFSNRVCSIKEIIEIIDIYKIYESYNQL